MYRFYRRKSFFVFVFLFLLIITATKAKADRIAILEKSATQQAPSLSVFNPYDQFTRRAGPGLPNNSIQFGNIVDSAGAEINGAEGEALILLGLSIYGYNTISVLEQSPDSVQPDFQLTAGVTYMGRYLKFITVGNFDTDSGKEIAVVSSDSYGRNGLMIYDLPATLMRYRPRWLASDPDIGGEIVALTSADMNGDAADELIITRKNIDGTFAVEVYNPPKTYYGDMGEVLSSFAGMGKNIIPNGVTAGEFDGDPEPELGLIWRLPDAGYQLEIFDAPRSLGDNAGNPLASVSIGSKDIIALTALNTTASDQTPNELPEAVIEEVPQQDAASLDISLDGSQSHDPDGFIVSYHWDFGDGFSADGPGVEYTYQIAGTYRVTLTVTDDQGAQDSTEITIEVLQPEDRNAPPQAFIHAEPLTGAAPLLAVFNAYSSRDPDGYIRTYYWQLDDRFLSYSRGFYYFFRTPGIYRVTLTVIDDEGAQNSATTTIEVLGPEPFNESPEAIIEVWPDKGVAPLKISLDARRSWDPDGIIQDYRWNLGDGTFAEGQSIQHVYNESGYYRVVLTVTDNKGAEDSTQFTIEVADEQGTDDSLLAEEEAVVTLINQERQKYSLPPLRIADELVDAARRHSTDMAENNIFSHTGSDGSSPFTRMTEAGYRFRYAGENVAAGYATAQQTVNAWMNSSGHRANILNRNFCEVGIGYVYNAGSFFRNYWTLTLGCR